MQPALDELLPAFTVDSGCVVRPEYAGSGLLLTRAQQPEVADLFLPGDREYVSELQRRTGRVAEAVDIAYLLPCIVVAGGNPMGVTSVADLGRPGLRLGLGNPKTCQVGRVADRVLRQAGLDPAAIDPKYSLTVSELGVWVRLGDVDAAVVWDATAAALAGTVDVVPIPADPGLLSRVTVALLTDAREAAAARQFLRFCVSSGAQGILRRRGYLVDLPPELRAADAPQGGLE